MSRADAADELGCAEPVRFSQRELRLTDPHWLAGLPLATRNATVCFGSVVTTLSEQASKEISVQFKSFCICFHRAPTLALVLRHRSGGLVDTVTSQTRRLRFRHRQRGATTSRSVPTTASNSACAPKSRDRRHCSAGSSGTY
jgi:hypothetical protein